MLLVSSGLTDVGQVRKSNQDSIYLDAKANFFMVADGMGGHNGGDIASALAVQKTPEYIMEKQADLPSEELMSNAIQYANTAIYQKGKAHPELKGMGTTIVSLYFKGPTLYVGNVGDSRAYLVNNKQLFQLSKDHSLVQEKINVGIYSRSDAASDPMKNVLVRTVGYEEDVDVDVFTYKFSPKDVIFACSDGLYGKVSDADIAYIINHYLPQPETATPKAVQQAVETLVKQANANGGNDNISVVMVLVQ